MFALPPIIQEPREAGVNFPKYNIQRVKSRKMNVDRQETSAASPALKHIFGFHEKTSDRNVVHYFWWQTLISNIHISLRIHEVKYKNN